MMHGARSITSVESSRPFGQLELDPGEEENGGTSDRVQPNVVVVDRSTAVVHGEMRSTDDHTTSEPSPFGTILNSPTSRGSDGGTARRPERLKIIVKRKVEPAKSPRKKQKVVDDNCLVPGENQGIIQSLATSAPGFLRQGFAPVVASGAGSVVAEVGDGAARIQHPSAAFGSLHSPGKDYWQPGSHMLLADDVSGYATGACPASIGMDFAVPTCGVVDCARIGPGLPTEESSVSGFGMHRAPKVEPGSPTNRVGSGGALLEQAQTPKAKRSPLFFPPAVSRAAEGIVRSSSSSEAPNPPALLPAKRSPLPLPGASSSVVQSQHYQEKAPAAGDYTISVDPFSGEMAQFEMFRSNLVQTEPQYTGGATLQGGREDSAGGGGDDVDASGEEEDTEEEGGSDQVEAEEEEELPAGRETEEYSQRRGTAEFCDMEEQGEEEEEDGPEDIDDADLVVDDEFVAGLRFDISDLDNDTSMNTAPDDKHIFRETFAPSEKSQIYMGYDTSYLSGNLIQDSALADSRFAFQSLVNGNPYQESLLEQLDSATCFDTGGATTTTTTTHSHQSEVFVEEEEDGVSTPTALEGVNACSRCGAQKTGRACECGSSSGEGDSREEDFASSVYTKPPAAVKKLVVKSPAGLNHHESVGSKGSVGGLAPCSAQSCKPTTTIKRLKVKMSSDISVNQELDFPVKRKGGKGAPATAKALLATGLLEGYSVEYIDRSGKIMLSGRIKGSGIICNCTKCQGHQVVNVSAFEKHAGSNARHPSDFIFLENGKNLREVIEAGQKAGATGKKVFEALKLAMGSASERTDHTDRSPTCAECGCCSNLISCSGPRCSRLYHKECAGISQNPPNGWLCAQCVNTENRKRLQKPAAMLARDSSAGKQDTNANMHKALFLPGAPGELPDDIKVGYYIKGQCFLTGVKRGAGIYCSCCNLIISCSQFEQHAGWGSRRNPYASIYLDDGRSLHCAALELSKQLDKTPLGNVEQCRECGDGGELVFCNGCPGAYHPECAGLVANPGARWFCPRCANQQNNAAAGCGNAGKVISKLRIQSGNKVGPNASKESPEDRCTHLLKASDTVVSGCVFCRSGEFAMGGFGPRTILLCDQCEREYHVGCLKEHGLADLTELPEGEWFCGKDCENIHKLMHVLVGVGTHSLAGSMVNQVLERHRKKDGSQEPSRFSWQLLHGRRGDPQNGKTLSEAAAIFSEMFDPIVDELSGRDLIPLMVHSRSVRDQDFAGMYCVVLKRNDEVVTAALVRIFGRQFAELPLVATRAGNQGQGYCKALVLSIERLLGLLSVKKLVLPAAEDTKGLWVNKFGFSRLSDEESRRLRSEVQMMLFKGSSLLKKSITPKYVEGIV